MRKDISSGAVMAFLDALEAKRVNMHGMLLCRGGEPCWEGYWRPFTTDRPHRAYSISKSFTALAIGLLQAEGRLRIRDPVCDFFPEYVCDQTSPEVRRATIRDLLTMRTPYRNTTYRASDADWSRSFFTARADHEPGTVFFYDTSASQVLAALAQKLTGRTLLEYLNERLLVPLGCTGERRWLTDGTGVCQGGTGLVLTLGDLSRVANCVLRGGDGLLPADYLREATACQVSTALQPTLDEQQGYGYFFWRARREGYVMYGLGGQLAVCLPEYGLTLCTFADTRLSPGGLEHIYDALYDHLLPNLTSAPACDDALRERLAGLTVAPVAHRTGLADWPEAEYALAPNGGGFRTLRLTKNALRWTDAQGEGELPFGVGKWEQSVLPGTSEPCMASAGQAAADSLLLRAHLIGDRPTGIELLLTWKGDRLAVRMRDANDDQTARFRGTLAGHRVGR